MTQEELNFFDRIAETWDEDEIRSTPSRVKSILSKLNIRKNDEILDLGTGTGVLIPYLSNAVGSKGRVVGIDISEGMLGRAKEKYGHLPNVIFERKDFETEVLHGRFDLILLYCVYPHLHTPLETLTKLRDFNLKGSGKLVVAFPSDESFINNIHREKKAESELLPSAYDLSSLFNSWGFDSDVIEYSKEEYIIEIKTASNKK